MQDFERNFLQRALERARSARRAPARLGLPLEPTWAAVLATPDRELCAEAFVPGDIQDAVRALTKKIEPLSHSQDDITLYLTIEPFSTYERLPPVTESIRALGVKKVFVGAENPSNRARGQGIASLEKQGVSVTLADGEIARQCQLLYEDYSKALSRSLPVLRLFWDLRDNGSDQLEFVAPQVRAMSFQHDAILWSDLDIARKENHDAWVIALDPYGQVKNKKEFASDRVLVFQSATNKSMEDSFTVTERDGSLDLASILRKLKDLGILSVLCGGNAELFQRALEAGLVDSVLSSVKRDGRSVASVLSHLYRSPVHGQGWDRSVKLLSPRVLEEQDDSLLVEAGVKIQ